MGLPMSPCPPSDVSIHDRTALPQYGFGPDVEFEKLVESNPFLFRVYTPKEPNPFYDRSEPYFVGPRFEEKFSDAGFNSQDPSTSPFRSPPSPTYADAAHHLDWTTRSSSPYVSTSFSFAWAIWEATRRYHHGVKHSVEIAVIDAKAVSSRAVTAVELLRKADPKDRHQDHWKWYRFALEAQDVLVWGYIPGNAVFASIPLSQVLTKLPSFFLSPDTPLSPDTKNAQTSQLGLAWDYSRRKPSFREFCQDVSARFLRMPPERRLRDTTAGAVRLALCHLRPWFHARALGDFPAASSTTVELALVIARWAGPWWVREHPEIESIVRAAVHVVGEEVREARRVQALADAARMQDIVAGLEQLAQTYQVRARMRKAVPSACTSPVEPKSPCAAPVLAEPLDPAATLLSPVARAPEPDLEKAEAVEEPESSPKAPRESPMQTFVRSASTLLTGFFLGTFVTLWVLAPDTRQLAHHLT
ncbi:uncharacterized protein FIBRA_01405 [Fibroporia radiculosa]|uniref:DUF7587 domain-containing protein n=1 Tax=Fibroporia radiculosa TaxID=599839 RepID=J4HTA9_9APHY|nr:uncharacterized protein FIBRA_01405 [Fibroporia radiculosa]CCL99387.1 predicted protein [Fibroporia radiculosa]